MPESTFRAGLPWVRPGVTTREETRLKLGIPGASFEDQRILAYGIVVTRDGSVAARFVEPDPQDPSLTPWGTYDSLVLVFDQAGVLRDFNIIRTER